MLNTLENVSEELIALAEDLIPIATSGAAYNDILDALVLAYFIHYGYNQSLVSRATGMSMRPLHLRLNKIGVARGAK